jgi:hypothetical protein
VDCNLEEILISAFVVEAADKVGVFKISVVVLLAVVVLGNIVCVIAEEGKTRTKFDVKLVARGNAVLVTSLVVDSGDPVDVSGTDSTVLLDTSVVTDGASLVIPVVVV